MKKRLMLILLFLSGTVAAQDNFTGEQQEVYRTVMQLFDGMRAGDSTMVHQAFVDDAQMYTAFTKEGSPVLHQGSLQEFLKAVGTPHDQLWDEPIWNVEIKIDDRLAQVWADYAFFYNGKFTHCGVDAFHLFKDTDGWKIFHLTDTRRVEGCDVPQEVKNKSEK